MIHRFPLTALSLGALVLAACSTTSKVPVAAVSAPAPSAPASAPAPVPAPGPVVATAPVTAPAVSTTPLPDYLDPKSAVSTQRSLYFDFDSAAVDPAQWTVIETQGRYLAAHPELHVRVEGNTDERGGAEYNLALGQKRAAAVQKALRVMGVKDEQVEAVSYGKERPRASGHDEAAWSQNRRADVSYPSK